MHNTITKRALPDESRFYCSTEPGPLIRAFGLSGSVLGLYLDEDDVFNTAKGSRALGL